MGVRTGVKRQRVAEFHAVSEFAFDFSDINDPERWAGVAARTCGMQVLHTDEPSTLLGRALAESSEGTGGGIDGTLDRSSHREGDLSRSAQKRY